jgi:hypothetical protein
MLGLKSVLMAALPTAYGKAHQVVRPLWSHVCVRSHMTLESRDKVTWQGCRACVCGAACLRVLLPWPAGELAQHCSHECFRKL